jgi:hypothetical protein
MDDKHEISRDYGGRNEMSWIQAKCSCGWQGEKYYAWQDLQRTLLRDEINEHIRQAAAETNTRL